MAGRAVHVLHVVSHRARGLDRIVVAQNAVCVQLMPGGIQMR